MCECGKLISSRQVRCDECESKKNKRQYEYDLTNHRKKYYSTRWKKLRNYILVKYNNMCLYSWYKFGEVRPAKIVHHIELANEDNFYDDSNLIPLDFNVHEELHRDYTDEVKAELKLYQEMWRNDFGK